MGSSMKKFGKPCHKVFYIEVFIFIKYESLILLLSACLSVLWMHTDPESVVITGAVCWHRLMTGLWPVCFCLFGVYCSTVGYLPSWQYVLALGWVSGLERRPVLLLHQALCQLETRLLNLHCSPPFSTLTAELTRSFWSWQPPMATPTFVCTSRVNSTLSLPVFLDHTSFPNLHQLPNWKGPFARSSTGIY